MKAITALIQAGGFGTRIQTVEARLPKPLIPIAGRAVLFRQIDWLLDAGIDDIVVLAGYKGQMVEDALKEEYPGRAIRCLIEESPLGTGGCLALAKRDIADRALVLSADVLFSFHLDELLAVHDKSGAAITLTLYPTSNPRDGDLIRVDPSGWVRSVLLRPHPTALLFENRVNAAATVVEKDVILAIPPNRALNFEKDILQGYIAGDRVASYTPLAFIKDMGTPERWEEANSYFRQSIRPAPFILDLDRIEKEQISNDSLGFWERWIQSAGLDLRQLQTFASEGRPILAIHRAFPEAPLFRHAFLDTVLASKSVKIDAYFSSQAAAERSSGLS